MGISDIGRGRTGMFAVVGLATGLLSSAVPAQAETIPHRVRGTIAAFDGTSLTVTTREGPTAHIGLATGWKVVGVAAAAQSDIKPGDYVGIASLTQADGTEAALEVLIFPKAMAGTGEGSFPWDLQPESTMTNATVASVDAVGATTLTLTYKGSEKVIAVPATAPVVTFGAASPADLVAGATVFVPGHVAEDGTMTTETVVVGTNGIVPPM